MDITNEEMIKSLTSLIDETLEEIEEIKKSKFAAAEVSLGDSESGMDSKSKNGELDAKKADEDEDEDKKKKEDKEMDKGENEKADEDAGKFAEAPSVSKMEDKEDDDKEEDKDDEKKEKKEDMKKSLEASETLMKSYVDEKFSTFSETLSKMQEAIEALADQPVVRRGVPAGITALQKSVEEVEPLSKADVANTLFELKKSGETIDSADIFTVETSNDPSTVMEIANKYGLKSKGDIR